MRLEAQAVEPRAGTEDAVVLRDDPREIRQRVGRICGYEEHRIWCGRDDLRDHVAVDFGVLVEEPQASFGIVAIGRPSRLLVHSRGDHHHAGTRQVRVVAIADVGALRQGTAVADVGGHSLGAGASPIHEHDLAREAADHERECARRANHACANDTDLHGDSLSADQLRLMINTMASAADA